MTDMTPEKRMQLYENAYRKAWGKGFPYKITYHHGWYTVSSLDRNATMKYRAQDVDRMIKNLEVRAR